MSSALSAAHAELTLGAIVAMVVNSRYPHGVGKVGARDRTSGEPVLTFRRSNLLYRTAMRFNRGLDRDKDGIACEKL